MTAEPVGEDIEALRQKLTGLRERTRPTQEHAGLPAEDLDHLIAALDDLQILAEDLRVQNEDLLTARQNLEEERQRYREIFDYAPDGYLVTDQRGLIQEANRAAARLLQVSQEGLMGKPLILFVMPEGRRALQDRLAQIRATPRSTMWEATLNPRTGPPIHAAMNVAALRGVGSAPTRLHWIIRDISERKRLEARFHATVESAPIAMLMVDSAGAVVLVNAETEKLFGYARRELLGRGVEALVPERSRGEHPQWRSRFIASPEARRMGAGRELFGLRKDGSEFPVEIGLSPVTTEEGLFVLSAILDLTERKQMEAQLAAQRNLLETTLRQAADAIVVFDAHGKLTFVNATARRLAGLDPDGTTLDIAPSVWGQAYNPRGRLIPLKEWAGPRALRGKPTSGREVRMVRPDGSSYDILISAAPLISSGREIVGAVVTYSHITDRKVMEDALRRQHRWDDALTTIGQAVTSLRPLEEILTRGLEGILRASGATLGLVRLVDPKTKDLVAVAHKGVQPEYLARAERIPWGTEPVGAVAVSGQPRVIGRPEEFPEYSHLSLLAGGAQTLVCLPLQAGGRVLGTLQLGHSEAEFFSPADVQAFLPAASMLAEAIQAEQLRTAVIKDAEEKAFLFRELDHRVRNHLAALISLLHLGAEEAEEPAADRLREMAERVARLADVHNLLTGRGMQPVEIRELSEIVAKNVLAAFPGGLHVQWRVTGTSVRVPPSRVTPIALILNELLTNCAKHAFPGLATGTVTIRVAYEEDQVELEVQDDGVGLDPARHPAGLGMIIVQTLVTQTLGGTVQFAADGRARVTVRFPQEQETPEGGAA